MAEISIIVPVYKVEPYLKRCVESILRQSFRDWELILVDDGSPDGCPAICDEYARSYENIHVIHQKNGGLSAARNAGLDYVMAHSASRWLTFLDSDDWLHSQYLERLRKGTGNPQVGISLCGYERTSRCAEEAEPGPALPEIMDPEEAYVRDYGLCMTACCKLIRRDLMQELRFPVGKLHEDCFVTQIPLFRSQKIAILREPLYYYYFNPASITRAAWKPKRLEELEAHEVRLQYLLDHGFEKAAREERRITILTIYEHTEALAQMETKQYASHLKDLRTLLRRRLKEDRALVPMDAETVWIYLMAWHTLPLWRLGKKLQHWYHRRKGTEV